MSNILGHKGPVILGYIIAAMLLEICHWM